MKTYISSSKTLTQEQGTQNYTVSIFLICMFLRILWLSKQWYDGKYIQHYSRRSISKIWV